ncbi:MAG: cupin domain-containing protein [Desulfobacula sp.]|jgi:uncharacterized protein|uniref:cupin domain-containing protein n=1 Tax=Desulfobacula sp. TaxID=2593537 RepID=UPI001E10795F|nr:cupin domain-containing protein [Desulfobacula sp.]MBT3804430.1 cupin domain-containing protein [Desulfobacula sp.]MBT4024976.1 cupin domain-containing protein [Desulfobacula sp.]MBT4198792.1 cupin domain-containing protein [Desulfobacula sp.]MBT4508671.1 cupin domain-containing protein [Desulfobacula sp.]
MKPINLTKHPEGGRFCEVFRSGKTISTSQGMIRPALTHIYFSLNPDERSRFHKVLSDEIWNLYQGAGLRLYTWDGSNTPPKCTTLSSGSNTFCHVIPAGIWQAAEPISDTVLLGCSVAPGFEFSDFTLIDPDSDEGKLLVSIAPELGRFTIP